MSNCVGGQSRDRLAHDTGTQVIGSERPSRSAAQSR